MKKSSLLMYGLIGMIVIVLISIILIIVLFFSNSKTSSNSDNNDYLVSGKIEYNEDGSMKISDMCSILTLDIAERVLNTTLVKDMTTDSNSCTYKTSDPTTGDVSIVTMLLNQYTVEEAKQQYDSVKSTAFGKEIEDVTELDADASYWSTTYYRLNILKGDKLIAISTLTAKNPDSKSLSIEIAKLILQKF
jgi:Tfp pilus assembly protein PilN